MVRLIDLIKNYPAQINAFSAVCALFVSALSIFFTIRTLRLQRIHNFKSLTPIANVLANDYENQLEVRIRTLASVHSYSSGSLHRTESRRRQT